MVSGKWIMSRSFTADQKPLLQSRFTAAIGAVELWASQGITAAMNRFNKSDLPLHNHRDAISRTSTCPSAYMIAVVVAIGDINRRA